MRRSACACNQPADSFSLDLYYLMIHEDRWEKLDPSYRHLALKVAEIYNGKDKADYFDGDCERLAQIALEVRGLLDKQVLDLGCGSERDPSGESDLDRGYPPWYCRLAHEAGAKVTGIDLFPNIGERFTTIVGDLITYSFDVFTDNSLDAVNNDSFCLPKESKRFNSGGNSPRLVYDYGNKLGRRYPTHLIPENEFSTDYHSVIMAKIARFNGDLFHDVEAKLKEGGVYTNAEFVYQKRSGKLVKTAILK